MTVTLADIIDAVAVDLAPLANKIASTGFLNWRYVEPNMLNADQAPWLAIYGPATAHTLVATPDQFMDDEDLIVEWAISISANVETGGQGDPALIRAAILAAQPILDRLKTYASGIPGLDNQILGTLISTARATTTSLVWRQTSHLTVNSTGEE